MQLKWMIICQHHFSNWFSLLLRKKCDPWDSFPFFVPKRFLPLSLLGEPYLSTWQVDLMKPNDECLCYKVPRVSISCQLVKHSRRHLARFGYHSEISQIFPTFLGWWSFYHYCVANFLAHKLSHRTTRIGLACCFSVGWKFDNIGWISYKVNQNICIFCQFPVTVFSDFMNCESTFHNSSWPPLARNWSEAIHGSIHLVLHNSFAFQSPQQIRPFSKTRKCWTREQETS